MHLQKRAIAPIRCAVASRVGLMVVETEDAVAKNLDNFFCKNHLP
jgi:hypothetical protein